MTKKEAKRLARAIVIGFELYHHHDCAHDDVTADNREMLIASICNAIASYAERHDGIYAAYQPLIDALADYYAHDNEHATAAEVEARITREIEE